MRRTTLILAIAASMGTLLPGIANAHLEEGVSRAEATFPYLGVVADVEKVEEGDGLTLRASSDGRPVDVEALAAEDAASRHERLGALDAALARHLERLGDDDRVPVALWLTEAERDLGARPEDGTEAKEVDAVLERQAGQRAEEVAAVTAPFLGMFRRFDPDASASTTSPVVRATLPVRLIRKLAADERVDTIYGDLEKGGPETELSRAVVGADLAPAAGLNGSGVQVGVVESGGLYDPANPFMSVERAEHAFLSCYAATQHATGVTGIIGARAGIAAVRSPSFPWPTVNVSSNLTGFANASRLFVGSWCPTGENRTRVDGAVNWGAKIVNNSYFSDTTGNVTVNDRHADGVVHNNWRLFVKSAGNRGGGDGRVTSPGNGYNVLAVGNVNLNGTTTRTDDTMSGSSSFVDPTSTFGDREKPEVAAPGTNINMLSAGFPFGGQTASGTSFAAPMVTGTAARLVQRKPFLGAWPEQLRAVLMAGAMHNIEGSSRLSDVDGAGMIAANTAVNILDGNRHGGRQVACGTFGPSQTMDTVTLQQGQRLRAAISWTADPSAPDHANRPSADLDLQVTGPAGSVFSASFDNTSEIVDFRAPVGGTYQVRVVNFRCNRSTFVGWAHTTA